MGDNVDNYWVEHHRQLKRIVIPAMVVIPCLYFFLCLYVRVFVYLFPFIYFVLACMYRETIWVVDRLCCENFGYYAMQSYLWSHVVKPPSWWVWVKIHLLWVFLFVPTFECRVRWLKKWFHKHNK